MELTLDTFKTAYPDLFDKIDAEAYQRGMAEGKITGADAGMKVGAENERERIKSVEAQTLPGHEKLISELKFDGMTTGEQAAVKVLAAEKALVSVKKDVFLTEHVQTAQVPEPAKEQDATAQTGPLSDEQMKANWDKDPALRAEFGNHYDAYQAYERAQETGKVKIYRGGK